MIILALDPATKTGWASSTGESGTVDLSVRRDESAGMKLVRLRGWLTRFYSDIKFDLLVFEAARHAAPAMQGALVVQAEIQGTIKLWCEDAQVEYRGFSPSEIKKHATGKGNAGKPAMRDAAISKGWIPANMDDNEIDARWLLDLAMKEYGG